MGFDSVFHLPQGGARLSRTEKTVVCVLIGVVIGFCTNRCHSYCKKKTKAKAKTPWKPKKVIDWTKFTKADWEMIEVSVEESNILQAGSKENTIM